MFVSSLFQLYFFESLIVFFGLVNLYWQYPPPSATFLASTFSFHVKSLFQAVSVVAASFFLGPLAMSAPSSQLPQHGAQAPPCPHSTHSAVAPLQHSAAAAGEASGHSFTQHNAHHHNVAWAASLRAPAPPPPPSRSNAILSSLLSLYSQHEAAMRAAREEIAANNAKADALVAAADMLSVARAHQQQQQQHWHQQHNNNNNSSTNANTTTAAASHNHQQKHQRHPHSSAAATPPLSLAAIGNGIVVSNVRSSRTAHAIDHHPHHHHHHASAPAGEGEGERATQQHRPLSKEARRHGQDDPPHAHSLPTAATVSDKAKTSLPASGIDSSLPPTAPDAASDAAAVPLPLPAGVAAIGVAAGEAFDSLGGRSRFFHQFMGGQTPSASQQSAEGGGSGEVGGLGMGSTAGEAPTAVAEAVRHSYPHLPIHPLSADVANSCAAVAPAMPQPVGRGGVVPPSVGVATPNAPLSERCLSRRGSASPARRGRSPNRRSRRLSPRRPLRFLRWLLLWRMRWPTLAFPQRF